MKKRSLLDVPEEGVSHNPEIRKRVMLRNGEIPSLTTFSQARFEPGQVCAAHAHETMFEVYLVESGGGVITVDGDEHRLAPGVCVVVEPGEVHQVANTEEEPLIVTYFGIAE